MGDELLRLEDAKAEVLAAFVAIAALLDRVGEQGRDASLGEEAVRHLSAALALMNRGKGGGA